MLCVCKSIGRRILDLPDMLSRKNDVVVRQSFTVKTDLLDDASSKIVLLFSLSWLLSVAERGVVVGGETKDRLMEEEEYNGCFLLLF